MTDTIISFLTKKYDDIIIDDESNLYMIEMYHRKNRRNTNILIEDNLIKIPKIKDYEDTYSFSISNEKVLTHNEIMFTGFYLIENCLNKNYLDNLNIINKYNCKSVNSHFKKFYELLSKKGIVCNTIIYDSYKELCFTVFTDDKSGLTGYIIIDDKLFSYSVDVEKMTDLYNFVNTSKNINVSSSLNATDESILTSYFSNNGFFTVCDLLHGYDFESLSYSQEFITIQKVIKSESIIINDLVNNNQLSLYEEE